MGRLGSKTAFFRPGRGAEGTTLVAFSGDLGKDSSEGSRPFPKTLPQGFRLKVSKRPIEPAGAEHLPSTHPPQNEDNAVGIFLLAPQCLGTHAGNINTGMREGTVLAEGCPSACFLEPGTVQPLAPQSPAPSACD